MAARIRFKADDIWQAPDDGKRYEVIDGELVVSPAPSLRHQNALHRLDFILTSWIYPRHLGMIVEAPVGVVLDPETAVEPDLVYVAQERLSILSERGVEGPPDLVVEVLSPSTEAQDRGLKMRRYAAAGVPNYWLLDASSGTLEPYWLREGGYELLGAYGPGTIYRPELFPGLEISIDELRAALSD